MEKALRKIVETPFFSLEELDSQQRGVIPYYRLSGPDSVIALVFNEEAEILIVTQFRPTLDEMTIEFPAGGIEPGEKPKSAARREVWEETGYRSELFQLGEYFHLMMNRTNIRDFLFCGIVEQQMPSAAEEGTSHAWVPREQLLSMALDGSYRQLAGLGILQLASQSLGIDVLTAPARHLVEGLRARIELPDAGKW